MLALTVLTYLVTATCGGSIIGGGTHGANISSGKQLMAVAYLVGDTRNGNISGWRHFGDTCSINISGGGTHGANISGGGSHGGGISGESTILITLHLSPCSFQKI
jgi:hypothetical protein